jgi:hypothetical protein
MRDIGRCHDAPDQKQVSKLLASLFERVAEQ